MAHDIPIGRSALLKSAFEAEPEAVSHPSHYGGKDNQYEVIKVLEAWLTPEEFAGFCKGNVIKYQARARMKGGTQDISKAAWYANRLADFETRRAKA